jgi:hypothetical protein
MYVGSELEVSSFYIIEHFYLWCIPLLHHYLTDIVVIITLDTCRYLRMQSGQSSLSTIFFYCPRTIPCIFRAIFHFSVTFLDIHRLQVIEHFLPTYYYWDRKVGNITILDYYRIFFYLSTLLIIYICTINVYFYCLKHAKIYLSFFYILISADQCGSDWSNWLQQFDLNIVLNTHNILFTFLRSVISVQFHNYSCMFVVANIF